MREFKQVNRTVRKKDSKALLSGKPLYTQDLCPAGALIVKILRSPHAHANIRNIDTTMAMKVPGIECILTHKDVPENRFAISGQSYPEWSPYDRRILDSKVRYVGDAVAIIAGADERCVDQAMKKIKVEYEILPAILDLHEAYENPVIIHDEDNWEMRAPFGGDNTRNLCAVDGESGGDVDEAMAKCAYTFEATYHTKQANQCMMEPYCAYTFLDAYERLNVYTSTQIPFHVRRILSNALGIPKSRIRVVKPRIGGGFGTKQTSVCEMFVAAVTMKTGKLAKIVFTREECFMCGSPRHEMEITVKVGADEEGKIRAIDMFTLSNTGAYGEHGPTTVGLTGRQTLSLYRYAKDFRFEGRVVYTNTTSAGAYRGFGATQGTFAMESAVNELAHKMGMDPAYVREINMIHEGDCMYCFGREITHACALDLCMERAKEMFNWEEKSKRRVMPDGKIRAGGCAITMQDSGIKYVDTASTRITLVEDGYYHLYIGATDMGTGCDTILAQMAAECMECDVEDVTTFGVDTDVSPYDTGSYASSTTYVTGGAVVKACDDLKKKMTEFAAQISDCSVEDVEFVGNGFYIHNETFLSLKDFYFQAVCGHEMVLTGEGSNMKEVAPPPFMVGMAEVEVDPETGNVEVIDFVNVADCGTVINPALAKVQVESGILQGLSMCLTEDVVYNKNGRLITNSYMQYGIPSRIQCGPIRVDFRTSYEPTGPFGAKSIGEVVINTASPAVAEAVWVATGKRFRTLPIKPEEIVL